MELLTLPPDLYPNTYSTSQMQRKDVSGEQNEIISWHARDRTLRGGKIYMLRTV